MQIFTLATVLRYFESRDLRDPSVAKLTTYHDIERPFAGYDACPCRSFACVQGQIQCNTMQTRSMYTYTHGCRREPRIRLIAFEAICAWMGDSVCRRLSIFLLICALRCLPALRRPFRCLRWTIFLKFPLFMESSQCLSLIVDRDYCVLADFNLVWNRF